LKSSSITSFCWRREHHPADAGSLFHLPVFWQPSSRRSRAAIPRSSKSPWRIAQDRSIPKPAKSPSQCSVTRNLNIQTTLPASRPGEPAAHGIEEKPGELAFRLDLSNHPLWLCNDAQQSRGGFVGLMVAIAVYIWTRLGWRRALPLMARWCCPSCFTCFQAADEPGRRERYRPAGGANPAWSQSLKSSAIRRSSASVGNSLRKGQVPITHFCIALRMGAFRAMFLARFLFIPVRSALGRQHGRSPRRPGAISSLPDGHPRWTGAGMMSPRAPTGSHLLVLGMASAYVQSTRAHSPVTVPIFCTRILAPGDTGSRFPSRNVFLHSSFVNWG